jgi:hypothetical protein
VSQHSWPMNAIPRGAWRFTVEKEMQMQMVFIAAATAALMIIPPSLLLVAHELSRIRLAIEKLLRAFCHLHGIRDE